MRGTLAIVSREVKAYFVSPMAYVILMAFMFIVGLFFYAYVVFYSNSSMQAQMNPAWAAQINLQDIVIRPFYSTFGVIMIFVAPMLSMRSLAEEKRLGTAELLLTAPLTTTQIVAGKYLGALCFAALMLALTFQFPLYLILQGAMPELGSMVAVYLGALLMVGAFLAVGVFSSSLTSNQIVAAVVAFVLCLVFWVIGSFGQMGGSVSEYSELLKGLSIAEHYQEFLKGVIDTGGVVYYVTFILFGLFLTVRVIDSGRWR